MTLGNVILYVKENFTKPHLKINIMKNPLKLNSVISYIILLVTILYFNTSYAQEAKSADNPMTSVDIASIFGPATIIVAAQQMPEEFYSFRPTSEMRSFGELLTHLAGSNYIMTAIAKGEEAPVYNIGTSKTEIIEGLQKSFEYSAEARKNMTPEQKGIMVTFMGESQPAGNVLDFTVFHSLSHYGNLVVYMRLKGLVPPSSQEGNPGNVAAK